MKLKFFWVWALGVMLTGCSTLQYPKQDFIGVYGRVMTVESVEDITGDVVRMALSPINSNARAERRNNYGFTQGKGWSGNGYSQRLYKLKDLKGRSFYTIESGSDARFSVGECVNYWMSSTIENPYYPRLSKPGPNCSLLASEPDPEKIYQYAVNDRILESRKLDSWLDEPVEKLIARWGKPNDVVKKADNVYELLYYRGYESTVYVNGMYSHQRTLQCYKYFTVKNRIIESWRYSGNNCI